MENTSYVSLSQVLSLQKQMDVTANNIANMSTSGFKSQGVLFVDLLNKAAGSKEGLAQVDTIATYRDLSPGALTPTYNDLDFAIQGKGYFSIQGSGGVKYTRDGGFSLNDKREIVTRAGYPLLGEGGPITVPAEASKITLSKDGTLSTDQGSLGKVKLVTFDDEQKLVSIGNNLFDGTQLQTKPVDQPHLEQGMIEASNVNPIVEMNKMISILRSYETSQHQLSTDHDRQLSMIQKLTKV